MRRTGEKQRRTPTPSPLISSSTVSLRYGRPSGVGAPLIRPLLDWYDRHRRDLPWRQTPDPYRVLVSEFMLQQTQAERVAPRFVAFLDQFPSFAALAAATTADVLRAWSGLGYNKRALRLQAIARAVESQYGGHLPSDVASLQQLPGIGKYTAAAIACFAFGAQVATVDTNIRRVLQRTVIGAAGSDATPQAIWDIAAQVLPAGRASDWNQALMDLGATICSARAPACVRCPLEALCRYRQEVREAGTADLAPAPSPARSTQRFAGSTRYYRGRVLRVLTALEPGQELPLPALGKQIKEDYAAYDAGWLEG
ncbi:MAG TPA: A/G-specific adenine glycosylase, partial [Chloroflexota bacterium]